MASERRSARAVLIDNQGHLLLIKRTRPGSAPYWTTPGGGVEDNDASVEAALHRELDEELGAKVDNVSQVFMFDAVSKNQTSTQHFFVARLHKIDESARRGPELSDPSRGQYELDRIDLHGNHLVTIDLKPIELKEFIMANQARLMTKAGVNLSTSRHNWRRTEPDDQMISKLPTLR